MDYSEDIEISIYKNLKPQNKERNYILEGNKDIMKEFLYDKENKKGFSALLHQSFYIGNLRNEIVRLYNYFFLIIGK